MLLSAYFNYLYSLGKCCSVWYSYGTSLFIGIVSSSVLSLILEYINYFKSRRETFERFYFQVDKMMKSICKYNKCEITEKDKLKNNIIVLKSVVNEDVKELGNIFAEFSFLTDKNKKRTYLFSIYQYFYDIKRLIATNVDELHRGLNIKSTLDFIDSVILDVRDDTDGIILIENKIFKDINDELYTLVDMINGKFQKEYKFKKTVITDKIFKLDTPEVEEILKLLNDEVKKNKNYTIEVPFLDEKQINNLYDKRYITFIKKITTKLLLQYQKKHTIILNIRIDTLKNTEVKNNFAPRNSSGDKISLTICSF